jgi:hypothetical protein
MSALFFMLGLWRAGQNPYGVYAHGINLNAPLSVLPFQWGAQFNPETVYTTWYFLSLCMYAVVLLLLWRTYPQAHAVVRLVWAVVWGSLWSSLWDGQIYMFLTLVTAVAWLLMERRGNIAAGILIGLLCTIKPNYLVWPVLLAFSGTWSVALGAGFAGIFLGAIPAIVYGPAIYRQWFAAALQVTHATQPGNASVAGALARVNAPPWVGAIACLLLLFGLALWARKTNPVPVQASGAALAAAILASPLGVVVQGNLPP